MHGFRVPKLVSRTSLALPLVGITVVVPNPSDISVVAGALDRLIDKGELVAINLVESRSKARQLSRSMDVPSSPVAITPAITTLGSM